MLFSFFKPLQYNGDTTLTDIFRNYKGYLTKALDGFILKSYTIQGSPRPETLAYQLYGNTDLYWVLLMINDIRDPYHDWLKTETACYESADQSYPENKVLYHMDAQGDRFYNLVEHPIGSNLWYDKGDTIRKYIQYDKALKAIDIYEDAVRTNDRRRSIKIIDPRDINNFISNFVKEMETA